MRTRLGQPDRSYTRPGWTERNNRNADAAIVRCIDFERALATLEADEQVILVWSYRDRMPRDRVAIAAGCSTRTVYTRLESGRRKLADELDRRGLL